MAARLTPREAALRHVREEHLSEFIVGRPDLNRPNGLAQRLGWRVRVTRRQVLPRRSSQGDGSRFAGDLGMRGYPDLTLVHPSQGRLIFAELKDEKGKPTEHQRAWLDDLARLVAPYGPELGIEVYLWRPRHQDILPTLLGPRWYEIPAGEDLGVWHPTRQS